MPTQTKPSEPYAGKQLGFRQFIVTDEIWTNYFLGLRLDSNWHDSASPYGKPVVPTMLLNSADNGFPGASFENDFGTL